MAFTNIGESEWNEEFGNKTNVQNKERDTKKQEELKHTILSIFSEMENNKRVFRRGKKVSISDDEFYMLYVDEKGVYGTHTKGNETKAYTKEQILELALAEAQM